MTYPDDYLKCSQVCGAEAGKPCVEKSGFVVVDGEYVGLEGAVVVLEADEPHSSRPLTAAAARAGGDHG